VLIVRINHVEQNIDISERL